MATYSAYRHIELDKVGKTKKRVSNQSTAISGVLNDTTDSSSSISSSNSSLNDSRSSLQNGCNGSTTNGSGIANHLNGGGSNGVVSSSPAMILNGTNNGYGKANVNYVGLNGKGGYNNNNTSNGSFNGSPGLNGHSGGNGVESRRSSTSSNASGSSRHNDTFSRLFGGADSVDSTPKRRNSSLNSQDVSNRNPVTGSGVNTWEFHPSKRA